MNIVIYYAPNYRHPSGIRGKVGCTKNFELRRTQYNMGRGVRILEVLKNTTPKKAAAAEFAWADKLGLKGKGIKGWKYDLAAKGGRIGGPVAGRLAVESGQMSELHKKFNRELSARAVASPRHDSKRVYECPHCGKVGRSSLMLRWHFTGCKYRGT